MGATGFVAWWLGRRTGVGTELISLFATSTTWVEECEVPGRHEGLDFDDREIGWIHA
jgi:hypothetical protein